MKKSLTTKIIGILAIVFGTVTIFSGSAILFGNQQAQEAAGNYVPFVLWFNFIAGFFYIIAGIAILRLQSWAKNLAALIAISTLLIFAAFGIHIFTGGNFEVKTIAALVLRSSVWLSIAYWAPSRVKD